MAIRTKNRTSNGMKGLAEVRVLNDYLRVIFKADGDTYQVRKDGWDRESGLYNVTLNKANDEIAFASPPGRSEPYLVKFLEFSNRVGASENSPGVPEPKIDPGGPRQGKNGQTYYAEDRLVFRAKLVVVEKGQYKGLNVVYTLPYIFTQDDLVPTLAMFEGTAGQRKVLEDFLRLTGLDMVNDEIPWSGNVLPWLEARLQAADKIFTVRLNEKGFVAKDGLSSIPAYLITPEMLGEEEKPAKKKAAAKSKAGAKKATRK
jgi:hypothetical protein